MLVHHCTPGKENRPIDASHAVVLFLSGILRGKLHVHAASQRPFICEVRSNPVRIGGSFNLPTVDAAARRDLIMHLSCIAMVRNSTMRMHSAVREIRPLEISFR